MVAAGAGRPPAPSPPPRLTGIDCFSPRRSEAGRRARGTPSPSGSGRCPGPGAHRGGRAGGLGHPPSHHGPGRIGVPDGEGHGRGHQRDGRGGQEGGVVGGQVGVVCPATTWVVPTAASTVASTRHAERAAQLALAVEQGRGRAGVGVGDGGERGGLGRRRTPGTWTGPWRTSGPASTTDWCRGPPGSSASWPRPLRPGPPTPGVGGRSGGRRSGWPAGRRPSPRWPRERC